MNLYKVKLICQAWNEYDGVQKFDAWFVVQAENETSAILNAKWKARREGYELYHAYDMPEPTVVRI